MGASFSYPHLSIWSEMHSALPTIEIGRKKKPIYLLEHYKPNPNRKLSTRI